MLSQAIIFIFSAVLVAATKPENEGLWENGCYYPFIALGSGCYHFTGDTKMNWVEGAEYCRALGGDLVSIDDADEDYTVTQYLRESKVQAESWIGGYDGGHEGEWFWEATWRPAQYLHWAPGEPNNSGGHENCIAVTAIDDYAWNDWQCLGKISIICEV